MMPDLEFDKTANQMALTLKNEYMDDPTGVQVQKKEEKILDAPHSDSKLFSCKTCHQIFDFSPIEALKHRNMCVNEFSRHP